MMFILIMSTKELIASNKDPKTKKVFKEGEDLINETFVADYKDDKAILINEKPQSFIDAIAKHRNWERMDIAAKVPA